MLLRVPRRLRAAAAIVAVAAYALPMSVTAVTSVVHDAYHLGSGEGVTATADARADEGARPRGFIHEHGGEAHSHGATTDALLGAAQHADDPTGEHHAPATDLSGHVPASADVAGVVPTLSWTLPGAIARLRALSPLPPPLRPPRA